MNKVIVTEAGDGFKFLDPFAKAFKVKAGETAVVLSQTYAHSLVRDGYAEWAEEPEPPLAETEAAVSDEEATAALVEVDGIGPKTAEKLVAAGIRSLAELVAADPAALATTLDVTESKVAAWQEASAQLQGE
jgi:predicted flap endonuclease-1-like 5' DNA nuclease